jgi:hypothetical protein
MDNCPCSMHSHPDNPRICAEMAPRAISIPKRPLNLPERPTNLRALCCRSTFRSQDNLASYSRITNRAPLAGYTDIRSQSNHALHPPRSIVYGYVLLLQPISGKRARNIKTSRCGYGSSTYHNSMLDSAFSIATVHQS